MALEGDRAVVEVARTFSGTAVVRYVVVDADGVESEPVVLVLDVAPDASAGAGPLVASGPTGAPVTSPAPTPSGTGPFSFVLLEPADPALGTTSLDAGTGVLVLDPAPGWSGVATARFAVADAGGRTSAPATAVLLVRPTTPDAPPATTTAGTAVVVRLPAPVGTGPFRWSLLAAVPPGQGSVELDALAGTVRVHPAPGWSGELVHAFAVSDAAGLVSDPAEGRVQVAGRDVEDPGPPTPDVPEGPDRPDRPSGSGARDGVGPGAPVADPPREGAGTASPVATLPHTGAPTGAGAALGALLLGAGWCLRRRTASRTVTTSRLQPSRRPSVAAPSMSSPRWRSWSGRRAKGAQAQRTTSSAARRGIRGR